MSGRRLQRRVALACAVAILACPAAAETADRSGEHWDLTAVFESGHRLFVRFALREEPVMGRSAYAIGRVVFPDGETVPFQNGRREGRWQATHDGRRLEVGSSVLDLRQRSLAFEVDKSRQGVKIRVDFEPGRSPARWGGAPPGLGFEAIAVGAPARGRLWVRERMGDASPEPLRGVVTLSHGWTEAEGSHAQEQRLDVHGLAPGEAPFLLVRAQPVSGAARAWLVAPRAPGVWRTLNELELRVEGRSSAGRDDYPLPGRLVFDGANAHGSVALGGLVAADEPRDRVPVLLRWLLAGEHRPWHAWVEVRFEVEWRDGASALRQDSSGIAAAYFTREVPDGAAP